MSPKVPKEYYKFRKQEIITAAWKCFAERGYQGTTMRDIAKSIGLSTGVIYNYFKNKDEILDSLLEWTQENEQQIFDSMAQKDNTKKAILELFTACFESCSFEELKESSKANIYMWAEAMTKRKIMEMTNIKMNQALDKLAQFIDDGINRGEIQDDLDSKSVARFYMALITGLQVQSVLIEDIDFFSYYKEIKKILFNNVWQDPGNNPVNKYRGEVLNESYTSMDNKRKKHDH